MVGKSVFRRSLCECVCAVASLRMTWQEKWTNRSAHRSPLRKTKKIFLPFPSSDERTRFFDRFEWVLAAIEPFRNPLSEKGDAMMLPLLVWVQIRTPYKENYKSSQMHVKKVSLNLFPITCHKESLGLVAVFQLKTEESCKNPCQSLWSRQWHKKLPRQRW